MVDEKTVYAASASLREWQWSKCTHAGGAPKPYGSVCGACAVTWHLDEVGRLRAERDAARLRVERDCERLADEVAVLVRRRVIDSRSPCGDALLDFRDPPSSPRADRLAALEAALEAETDRLRAPCPGANCGGCFFCRAPG